MSIFNAVLQDTEAQSLNNCSRSQNFEELELTSESGFPTPHHTLSEKKTTLWISKTLSSTYLPIYQYLIWFS